MSILRELSWFAQNLGIPIWVACGALAFAGLMLLWPRDRIDEGSVAWLVTTAWLLIPLGTVQVVIEYPFSIIGHPVYFADVAYRVCVWVLGCLLLPMLLTVPVAILVVKKDVLAAFRSHRWSYVAMLVVVLDMITFLVLLNCAASAKPDMQF
jgi:hypothetical protein